MEVRQAGGATPGLEGHRALIGVLATAGIVAQGVPGHDYAPYLEE